MHMIKFFRNLTEIQLALGRDLNMNPWKKILLSDYENHMSLESVAQLQALNRIMKEQFYRMVNICYGSILQNRWKDKKQFYTLNETGI